VNIKLGCQGYTVNRPISGAVTFDVKLVLHGSPRDTKLVAEALKQIELYLSCPINMVAAADRPRCFYCAGLNDDEAKECEHCGAML
jgi:hypothetical protein